MAKPPDPIVMTPETEVIVARCVTTVEEKVVEGIKVQYRTTTTTNEWRLPGSVAQLLRFAIEQL